MNEETFYKIKLDLVHNTINNFVHVMQYDDGVAYIRAEIYKDWQHVYPSEEFDSAELRLKKHDGAWIKCNSVEPYIPVAKPPYAEAKEAGVYYYYSEGSYILVTSSMTEQAYDALDPNLFYKNVGIIVSLEHDYVKINVVEELTDIPGGCPAVIDLYSTDGHIQTAKFVLDVDRNPIQTGETVKNVPEDISAKLSEMSKGIANTVKVTPQTLTDEEKAQARANIGADSSDSYTKEQADSRFVSLTANQEIGGIKKFISGSMEVNGRNPSIIIYEPNVALTYYKHNEIATNLGNTHLKFPNVTNGTYTFAMLSDLPTILTGAKYYIDKETGDAEFTGILYASNLNVRQDLSVVGHIRTSGVDIGNDIWLNKGSLQGAGLIVSDEIDAPVRYSASVTTMMDYNPALYYTENFGKNPQDYRVGHYFLGRFHGATLGINDSLTDNWELYQDSAWSHYLVDGSTVKDEKANRKQIAYQLAVNTVTREKYERIATEIIYDGSGAIWGKWNKIGNLNLENGPGANSIQQKESSKGFEFDNPNYTPTVDTSFGAKGKDSTVLNGNSMAYGELSTAEGRSTLAIGIRSHAEGTKTVSANSNAHAEGLQSVASGEHSHAEGHQSVASGFSAHAQNSQTKATGEDSTAIGYQSQATGLASFSQGTRTKATSANAVAMGADSISNGYASIASGISTKSGFTSRYWVDYTQTERGSKTIQTDGTITVISAICDKGYAIYTEVNNKTISYRISPAPTSTNKVLFQIIYAISGSTPQPPAPPVDVPDNTATYAEGYNTEAFLFGSHAQNINTRAIGKGTTAEGYNTTAFGDFSNACGQDTFARGTSSFAQGYKSESFGNSSVALNIGTYAANDGQTVVGTYNEKTNNAVFIVGNGTSDQYRHNAFVVYQDGHAEVKEQGTTDKSVAQVKFVKDYVAEHSGGGGKLYVHTISMSFSKNDEAGTWYSISTKVIRTTNAALTDAQMKALLANPQTGFCKMSWQGWGPPMDKIVGSAADYMTEDSGEIEIKEVDGTNWMTIIDRSEVYNIPTYNDYITEVV